MAIIGAGRVGQALALALARAGYPITALVARGPRKAEQAVHKLTKSTPVALGAGDLKRLPPSNVTLICTPDDAIHEVATRLAVATKPGVALHTSGALSSEVLAPLRTAGFHVGSIHPLVSISEPLAGAKALRGAFYCLEGDQPAMRVAKRIVVDLKGKSFAIRPESKALYHAAAVMASPHMVALFDFAVTMLEECGLNRRNARQVLLPLIESTVANLKVSDAASALTGTFARGDLATVERHLKALSGSTSGALEVYRLLGLHSLKLADRNAMDAKTIKQIRKLLGGLHERHGT